MVINERSIHRYLTFSIILVLTIGLFADIVDFDSAKYASISLKLLKNNDWIHIQYINTDYTYLPPLFFWLSALSFKLFGISTFSYKLFGVIFALMGMYSTFQLTKIYYGQRAGRIAAIILGTTLGTFTLTLDGQADTLLLGTIIFAIWQITEYLRNHQTKNFLLGLIGIYTGTLAQGLIGLLIPILVIGSSLVLRQKWKDLFKWRWVLGLVMIAFFLTPLFYGQDKQLKNSESAISGLHLFFTQSHLGQPLKIAESFLTNLWAFLPWIILFTLALVDKMTHFLALKNKKKSKKYPEHISLAGLTITTLVLIIVKHPSFYLLAPFCAMLTAAYIDKITQKNQHYIYISQAFLVFGLWMLSFLLLFYIFTPVNIVVALISILLFVLTVWSLLKLPQKKALVVATAIGSISFGFIQSQHLYPRLSNYRSGIQVGKWLKAHPKESEQFSNFRILSNTENFYSRQVVDTKRKLSQLSSKDRFLYTDKVGLTLIKQATIPYLVLKEYSHSNTSMLNLTFINPKTRASALKKRYLIAIYPQGK